MSDKGPGSARVDAVVVGGGPAGAMAAACLARTGRVILVSSNRPDCRRCTGLISRRGLERMGISARHFVVNEVSGTTLFAPSGRSVHLEGPEVQAYVVDRPAFDQHLRLLAQEAGAELVEGRAQVGPDRSVEVQGQRFHPERLVLATGTDYSLHAELELQVPSRFLLASQVDAKVHCPENRVELHFDVPGFFAWVVPAGDHARVGAATFGDPLPHVQALLEKLRRQGRLTSRMVPLRSTGRIPLHEPGLRTQYAGVLTVGDAAGQVKASTGGGVVYGGLAAQLVDREDYEQAWRRVAGRELRLHLLVRQLLNRLSPSGLERLLMLLAEQRGALEENPDMDSAGRLLAALTVSPSAWRSLWRHGPALLRSLVSGS